MRKMLKALTTIFLTIFFFFEVEKVNALIPHYYFPTIKNLKKESISIGKYAYELLYYGQPQESLNLAKLAVKINNTDQKLWLILSEIQIANELYKKALISLKKAEKINPKKSEIYFTKSNIYLKISQLENAKIALKKGLKIEPKNYKAIFQLGNISLMENNYSKALDLFEKSIEIKPDFWQAINNKGLAYYEQENIDLSIQNFEKAISIQENAEPLLGLASCLRTKDIELAMQLVKKALEKDPNYVDFDYRKEQLWGEKLQRSTEILLQLNQLAKDVNFAKSKIHESS